MAPSLITSLARPEKEIAVLDIVKSAEAGKKRLDISISGELAAWVRDAISKRGHNIGENGRDLSILIDQQLSKESLKKARKESARVALINPSESMGPIPEKWSGIGRGSIATEEILHDAEVREIFYGLWNVAYFGFEKPRRAGSTYFAIFCFIAILALFILPVDPLDDLLRHAKAHEFGYDYSKLYIYAWNFSFDPYLAFDHFAGAMDSSFGPMGVKLIQMLCLAFFGLGFYLNTREWDDRFRIFCFVLTLSLIGLRISLGRPEAFEAAFFLIGLTLTGVPAVLWGVLMGSFYFLFPIYLVPLAIVRREYALSLLIALALWVNYAGMAYFTDIFHMVTDILFNRVAPISENVSLLFFLGNPAFLFLAFLFIKSRDWRNLIPLGFFTALNQVRYIDILAPLMAITLDARKTGFAGIRFGFLGNLFFLAAMVACLHYVFPWHSLENIQVHDQRVLCDTMPCMYNVIFTGKNNTISPSMEYGFSEKDIQLATYNMYANGTLDCGLFDRYDFDVLVESSLKGPAPPCLELQGVEGKYRVWRIR